MNNVGFFNKTLNKKKSLYKIEMINLIEDVLKNEKIKDAELNIILVTKKEIKKINKKYRKIKKATDVISFALEDEKDTVAYEKRMLGDIYICLKIAKKQAKEYNHSLKRELCFLTTHGVLHLLGYTHDTVSKEKKMMKKQEAILNERNITRRT